MKYALGALLLLLLCFYACPAAASPALANVGSNNSCSGATCTASVTSAVGDLVFAVCSVGTPTSGAAGTPSFSTGSVVLTTAQWNSPWYYTETAYQIRSSGASTSMTCNTTGTFSDGYVHLFDFHDPSGPVTLDCVSWAINLNDSAIQSTVPQTPTFANDLAFGYQFGEPTAGSSFTLTGGGAPTCTITGISGVNASYCTATLSAANFTSLNAAATGAGDAYAMGLVMISPAGTSPTNPAIFVQGGMVGLK